MRCLALVFCALTATLPAQQSGRRPQQSVVQERPNILFAIADDWGWPHAGAYGDAVVKTPTFDRIAAQGLLFEHAFVSSPSCTPSRGAILTGKYHWQLGSGANLYGTFRDDLKTFVDHLTAAGYEAGCTGKTWGPGRPQTRGRKLAGTRHKSFAKFLGARDTKKPFVFWLGTSDPHRPFKKGAGKKSGMDLSKVHMFGHFPDCDEIRGDVADYYVEVQRFDRLVGDALVRLAKLGLLQNTLVVMTGDHGMPFPRCKSNLYDAGTRVPLAMMWGENIRKPGRRTKLFTSLVDLAPTFLEAAGLAVPKEMRGRTLLPLLRDPNHTDRRREMVFFGKERHVPSQKAPDMGGYPSRAVRTEQFLFIWNITPERWPNGTPDFANAAIPGNWYADTDNGPTKTYIIANKDKDEEHRRAWDLCFGKRPRYELYDVKKDPDQLQNLATDPAYARDIAGFRRAMSVTMLRTGDARMGKVSYPEWDEAKYSGGGPKHPSWKKKRRKNRKKK